MSEFKVPLTTIKEILPHPNPEVLRLELAVVYGFQVVIPKGRYSVGSTVLYMPIDSVLPEDLEAFLFAPDAKIKLHHSRIKQIRIQKFPSQGMLVSEDDLKSFMKVSSLPQLETDMAETLKVIKYEPPAPSYQSGVRNALGSRNKPLENPLFHKYNSLENIKWYPGLFKEGDEVVIQEKLHGTNCRAAILPTVKPTLAQLVALLKTFPQSYQRKLLLVSAFNMLKRIVLGRLNLLPAYENCYGSNNVELTNRAGYVGFYGEDVYGMALAKVEAFEKMQQNEEIFGEIIGQGVQKNYDYGHKERHFVLFDVKVLKDGVMTWLDPEEVEEYAKERGFDFVPVLYRGPFNKEAAYELTKGDSVYCPKQKIREGIAVKARKGYHDTNSASNKKALKWISEAYLDKDNSDFH